MPDYKLLPDQQLIALLKASDQAAFAELYGRYWPSMYVYARKILHDTTFAEDVVQEVLAYLWSRRENLMITNSVAAYLYSSVRYSILNMIKREQLHDRYLKSLGDFVDKGECIPDQYIREKELQQKIEKIVAALPPKTRKIFELSKVEGISNKNISAILDISDKTVRNQISSALKTLKLKLKKSSVVIR